jgi:hypothetical protein
MDAAVNNLSSIFSSIFSSKRPGQPLHLLWRVWNRWPQVFEKEQGPTVNNQPMVCNSMVDSPRYVLNQLKIFVAVGKDIKIVTPEK